MKASCRQIIAVMGGYSAYIFAANDFLNDITTSFIYYPTWLSAVTVCVVLVAPFGLIPILNEVVNETR